MFQLQAQKTSKARQGDAMAASGPAGKTNDPCPDANQSVETTTLKEYARNADEYSIQILPGDLQIKALHTKDSVQLFLSL